MADIIDVVQEWNELHHKVSLHNQSLKMLPESHPDFNGTDCVDCGDAVAKLRLDWGRVRCAPCQELKELDDAARARNGRPE